MTTEHLRLNAGAVFLRCATAFFVVREVYVWQWVRRIPARQGTRLLIFLFHKRATPRSLLYALVFAVMMTFVLNLLVRLVLRPLVRYWHSPRTDDSAGSFHMAANEQVVETAPARRASGRSWLPGTLVRSNLRLWFFPVAHDAEIWSSPLEALREVIMVPGPRFAWGYISGWPDRLAIETDAGEDAVFAVADPATVRSWFPTPQVVEA